MRIQVLALAMLAMLPLGAVFANDEKKNDEAVNVSVTENVDFSISRTTYDPSVAPAVDATDAPYNSLNLEIGLSKLRIFGYAEQKAPTRMVLKCSASS